MTTPGLATIVGQSAASAVTGAVAESSGSQASMWLPVGAAALVVLAALVNALACRTPAGTEISAADEDVLEEARRLTELALSSTSDPVRIVQHEQYVTNQLK